jgi:hypothetical protein
MNLFQCCSFWFALKSLIDVTENPFRVPPIDVVKRGRVAIQNYLRGGMSQRQIFCLN